MIVAKVGKLIFLVRKPLIRRFWGSYRYRDPQISYVGASLLIANPQIFHDKSANFKFAKEGGRYYMGVALNYSIFDKKWSKLGTNTYINSNKNTQMKKQLQVCVFDMKIKQIYSY
jgi:hypothetical protein